MNGWLPRAREPAPEGVDVIVEVEGWISAGASAGGTRYVPAESPARVLDTRASTRTGACPATTGECTTLSGGPRIVQVAGQGPVPAGVSSVLATVTVFGAVSVGVLQAYPGGGSAPDGLSMVFNGGVPVTQLVALPLNADGQVTLTSWFAAVDVTVDVVGWNVAATGTWGYSYSPDGLRAAKTRPAGTGIGATSFTWDRASGLPMLLAQDQAGVGVTYFVYGPGGLPVEQINPDGTTVWLHHDQIGSTRLATDSAGAVVATWSYDPYGNAEARTGTIDVPLGYTGQYTDTETGLQYLRARYYDPATGTFLTRDPLNAMTRSAYGYTYGSPLNGSDPSGQVCLSLSCARHAVGHVASSVENLAVSTVTNGAADCVMGLTCESDAKSLAELHPEASQAVVDFSSGVLEANPITATTNTFGLTNTSQYANTSSNTYRFGVLSMALANGVFGATSSEVATAFAGLGAVTNSVTCISGTGSCAWAVAMIGLDVVTAGAQQMGSLGARNFFNFLSATLNHVSLGPDGC